MKTGQQYFLMGDMMDEHRCDNCEEVLDAIGFFYWQDRDFTLCHVCALDLANGEKKIAPATTISKKQPIPEVLKWSIWERDDFECQYCRSRKFLTIDHVHPESHGGTLDESNLVTACKSCNSRKGARTPEQAGMKLIREQNGS